jgi:hypothetical protein
LSSFFEVKDHDALQDVSNYNLVANGLYALDISSADLAVELVESDVVIEADIELVNTQAVVLADCEEAMVFFQSCYSLHASLEVKLFEKLESTLFTV